MNLKETIDRDYIEAYKAQDTDKVSILRMVKSAVKNAEIANKADLADEDVVRVLKRELNQRQEALLEYEKAGRNESVETEKSAIELLKSYLPAEIEEAELKTIIKDTITETGASSMADLGKTIGAVMKKVQGKADGGKVSALTKEILSQKQ